ncbi:MAG: hypothetical protein VXW65_03070 [Pseudomonadota bacterium]|nr:hypothetical protein [Pseudomonadota bacterium]
MSIFRKILLIFSVFFHLEKTYAAPNLIGSWQSDRDSSLDYVYKHCELPAKTQSFLEQILGKMMLTFTEQAATAHSPTVTVSIEEKPYQIDGYTETQSYQVVNETPSTLTILFHASSTAPSKTTTYHFENPNRIWVDVEGFNIRPLAKIIF